MLLTAGFASFLPSRSGTAVFRELRRAAPTWWTWWWRRRATGGAKLLYLLRGAASAPQVRLVLPGAGIASFLPGRSGTAILYELR